RRYGEANRPRAPSRHLWVARHPDGGRIRPDVPLPDRRRGRGHLPARLTARRRGAAPLPRLLLPADVSPPVRLRSLDEARRLFLVRRSPAFGGLLGHAWAPRLSPDRSRGGFPTLARGRGRAIAAVGPPLRLVPPDSSST